MGEISVSIAMLLIKGIPEGVLTSLAIHIFTRTKINMKKFVTYTSIYIVIVYIIRFLPITLGVNTVLSLFILIFLFQFIYKFHLSKFIIAIISSVITLILVAISEVLNMIILSMLYGQGKAEELFNSSVGLTKGIYTIPSTIFLAILIYLGYLTIKLFEKRKKLNGKAGKKISK